MVLGNAGKKISTIVELAEELYERMMELREEVDELRGTVEDTHARVESIEREAADQRALLEALAAEQGVDVGAVLEESAGSRGTDGDADPSTE